MTNQYTPKDIETFNRKDQRISWLSIFSSIVERYKDVLIEDAVEKAFEINDKLYTKYPFVENNEEEKPL